MGQKLKINEIYRKVSEAVVGRQTEIKSILTAMDAGKHILLEGPPGTSKSTLLRTIAKTADIPFYIIEGNIEKHAMIKRISLIKKAHDVDTNLFHRKWLGNEKIWGQKWGPRLSKS